jgi:hypothetical protein
MRVLLADQDFSTGRGIRAMLLQSGFTVATIEEMDDVPSYARHEDFDVILMVTPRQAQDPYAMVAAVRRAGVTAPIMLVGADRFTLFCSAPPKPKARPTVVKRPMVNPQQLISDDQSVGSCDPQRCGR